MDNPWLLLVFLSVFHVIGAAVLANGLREFWEGLREGNPRGCRLAFLTVWATMFGCLPFGFGVGLAATDEGTPLVLLGQVVVWLSTFLAALLAQQILKQVLEPFLHEETLLMLFGGGFAVAGIAMVTLMTREAGPAVVPVGVILLLVGSLIVVYGLWRLFRVTR